MKELRVGADETGTTCPCFQRGSAVFLLFEALPVHPSHDQHLMSLPSCLCNFSGARTPCLILIGIIFLASLCCSFKEYVAGGGGGGVGSVLLSAWPCALGGPHRQRTLAPPAKNSQPSRRQASEPIMMSARCAQGATGAGQRKREGLSQGGA